MAGSIYKLWMARRTEAWYQLSDEAQQSLLEKVSASSHRVGCRIVIICDSAWSSEQALSFGVEEFPSVEAIQEHTQDLIDLDWFRYVESTSILGTKSDFS
jgi:hypothetical protein